jgi:sec-independent protein translocase protein TatA
MGLENPLHLAILFVIILLLFGARRLPELGRSLGEGMRGFKESISGESPPESSTSLPAAQTPAAQPTSPVAEPVAAPTAEPVAEPAAPAAPPEQSPPAAEHAARAPESH